MELDLEAIRKQCNAALVNHPGAYTSIEATTALALLNALREARDAALEEAAACMEKQGDMHKELAPQFARVELSAKHSSMAHTYHCAAEHIRAMKSPQ